MKFGRLSLAAAAVAFGLCGSNASASNGSNYVHLMNGLDYFILFANPTPLAGNGFFRCFTHEILHAPTKVVNNADANFGTYATKITAMHWGNTGSVGFTLTWPLLSISSGQGDCRLIDPSTGLPNFGLFTPAPCAAFGGAGYFPPAGPLNSAGTLQNELDICGAALVNPAGAANQIVQVFITIAGLTGGNPSTITVPEGDNVVEFIADNNLQLGPGTRQYPLVSADEKNLCSTVSTLLTTGATAVFKIPANWEWDAGFGVLDATNDPTVSATSLNPAGLNAQAAFGIDAGQGGRTLSITNSGAGGETLGFLTYDENNANSSGHLVLANVYRVSHTCLPGSGTQFATGGPGGPVLSNIIPQMPRISTKVDFLTIALLNSGVWFALTGHNVVPGGVNIPWFPAATIGDSGASGVTGGVLIPVPPFPTLPGVALDTSSLNLALPLGFAGQHLGKTANSGHSNSCSSDITFFP
jgi:hypothetical protein